MGRNHTHGVLCHPCVYLVKNAGQRSCQKGCCPFLSFIRTKVWLLQCGCLVVGSKGSPVSHLLWGWRLIMSVFVRILLI